jgi:hypothetical protein
VTVGATRKAGEKTREMISDFTEIALSKPPPPTIPKRVDGGTLPH